MIPLVSTTADWFVGFEVYEHGRRANEIIYLEFNKSIGHNCRWSAISTVYSPSTGREIAIRETLNPVFRIAEWLRCDCDRYCFFFFYFIFLILLTTVVVVVLLFFRVYIEHEWIHQIGTRYHLFLLIFQRHFKNIESHRDLLWRWWWCCRVTRKFALRNLICCCESNRIYSWEILLQIDGSRW